MLFARIQQSKSWLFQALSSYFIIRYHQANIVSASSWVLLSEPAQLLPPFTACWRLYWHVQTLLTESILCIELKDSPKMLRQLWRDWFYSQQVDITAGTGAKCPQKIKQGVYDYSFRIWLGDVWTVTGRVNLGRRGQLHFKGKYSYLMHLDQAGVLSCQVNAQWTDRPWYLDALYMVLFNILPSLCITLHHSAQLLNIRSCAGAVQTLRLCLYKSRDRGWIRDPWIAKPGGKDGIPWDTRVSVVLGAGAEVSKPINSHKRWSAHSVPIRKSVQNAGVSLNLSLQGRTNACMHANEWTTQRLFDGLSVWFID